MAALFTTRVERRHWALARALLMVCLGTLPFGAAAEAPPSMPLAIVVNAANPLADITTADLRAVLLTERSQWSNGRRITVVLPEPGEPQRDAILLRVCGFTESAYQKHLLHRVFVGLPSREPKVLTTPVGARRYVFNVPGAIAFLPLDMVDGSVKVVSLDGALPGQAGYRLTVP